MEARTNARWTQITCCFVSVPRPLAARALLVVGGLLTTSATAIASPAAASVAALSGGSQLHLAGALESHGESPASLDDASRERIAQLSSLLFDLNAAELDAAAATHRRTTPRALVLAIVDRAGRPVPPGLSRARRDQRRARALEARSWLERELASPMAEGAITGALDLALQRTGDEPTAIARGVGETLTASAMRVVAELDLAAHAPAVAMWLAEDASPALRATAAESLHSMYGRWFDTPEAFATVWPTLLGRAPKDTGRDALLTAHGEANERALLLIEHAPSAFAETRDGDLLGWRDPAMAARAARALGRTVAAGLVSPDDARKQLSSGLMEERRSLVLHARLETLLDLGQGADPASESAVALRATYADLAAALGDASSGGAADASWIALTGLPRLPLEYGEAGDPSRASILEAGVELFAQTLRTESGNVGSFDPDAMQGALGALIDLARAIRNEDARTEAARPLADLARPLVLSAGPLPTRVRKAASRALALAPEPGDAVELAKLATNMRTPELEYELLGALTSALRVVRPGGERAEGVISALFQAVSQPEYDERKRALELLLSDEVRVYLEAVPRPTRGRFLAEALGAEDAPDLRAKRLDLLARIGDADALALLSPSVPLSGTQSAGTELSPAEPTDGKPKESSSGIRKLVGDEDEVAKALARAAIRLAPDDHELRMRIAVDLAGTIPAPGLTDPGAIVRCREALRVALDGSDELAIAAKPADHQWVVTAGLALRHAAPTLAREFFAEPGITGRVELHAELLVSEDRRPPVDVTLLGAVLAADGIVLQTRFGTEPIADLQKRINRAASNFESAADRIAAATNRVGGWSALDVRRENFDLLRAVNRSGQALIAMDRLLLEDGFDASKIPAATLRSFVDLIESQGTKAPERLASGLRMRMACIAGDGWPNEDAIRQLEDIESALRLAASVPEEAEAKAAAATLRSMLVTDGGEESPLTEAYRALDEARAEAVLASANKLAPAPSPGATPEPEGDGEENSKPTEEDA